MKLSSYFAIAGMSARASAAYPADLAGRTGFFLLIVFILSRVWEQLLKGGASEGFGPTELIWYLVFTESLLLAVPHFEQNIVDEIRSGGVAYMLVRPSDYLGHHLAVYSGDVLVRLGMNLAVGSCLALLLGGPPPTTLSSLPWVLTAAALGLLLHFQLVASMAMLAFWLEEVRPFFWIYQKVLFTAGGLMLPLEFFPETLRRVLDLLPFGSVLYAPARLGVSCEPAAASRLIGIQLVWLAIFTLAARLVFRFASKRLQANGG